MSNDLCLYILRGGQGVLTPRQITSYMGLYRSKHLDPLENVGPLLVLRKSIVFYVIKPLEPLCKLLNRLMLPEKTTKNVVPLTIIPGSEHVSMYILGNIM